MAARSNPLYDTRPAHLPERTSKPAGNDQEASEPPDAAGGSPEATPQPITVSRSDELLVRLYAGAVGMLFLGLIFLSYYGARWLL